MAYDVFISFKNTAPGGGLTVDRAIAERLHTKLRDEGLEVFFSEKDLSTTAFMNEIYRALEEAQLLILIGSSIDFIKSKWVMSEWQNFLGAMNIGKKPDGEIMTVLSGITNLDLPIELANFQSYDAEDLDGAVDFAFKALGKVKKSEAAEWLAREEERKRREAEEAALLEVQKRLEAERQAELEKAAAEENRRKAMETAELEQKKRLDAERKAAEAQETSDKQVWQNRILKIVATVLVMATLIAMLVSMYTPDYTFGVYSDGTYCITDYSEKTLIANLVLPDTHKNRSVTGIGTGAFANCDSLETVTIPYGMKSIGTRSFENCRNLTTVTIPDSVTSIYDWAFAFCESLSTITIPSSVTYIGEAAFWDCSIKVIAPHEASYYGYDPNDRVIWIVK